MCKTKQFHFTRLLKPQPPSRLIFHVYILILIPSYITQIGYLYYTHITLLFLYFHTSLIPLSHYTHIHLLSQFYFNLLSSSYWSSKVFITFVIFIVLFSFLSGDLCSTLETFIFLHEESYWTQCIHLSLIRSCRVTSFFVESLTYILFQCINLKTRNHCECRIEVRMIPDSCNGKGFDSENWAFSEISLWSRVEK